MLENRLAHSGPLMKKWGVLNMKNVYNYSAGQFMFSYVNKLFQSYFTLSIFVHTYIHKATVFISSAILSYKLR